MNTVVYHSGSSFMQHKWRKPYFVRRTAQFRRLRDVLEREERVKFMTPALFILSVMH